MIPKINRKGDISDMMIFLITMFVLMIGFFILSFVIPFISEGLGVAGLNETTEGFNAIESIERFGTVTIQRGAFFLFVGLAIGVMVSSFFTRAHPMFLFLYIFLLGLTVLVGFYLGNAYESLVNTPIFAEALASQGLINVVMGNIIKITIAVGALSLIIVFSKFTVGGRQRV